MKTVVVAWLFLLGYLVNRILVRSTGKGLTPKTPIGVFPDYTAVT